MIIEEIKINENSPTYFIADIAANHDGDLDRAISLIYSAADNGANAAKFQHFSAETLVSDRGFKSLMETKSHQSKWKKSVYETYSDYSINLEWTISIKKACDDAGIAFFTSPYSVELVDAIDPYVPAHKIGSGDITYIDIIEHIARKNKPYFLATGASNLDDIFRAVEVCQKINPNFCLMQCNTNYTGSFENFQYINLNVLKLYNLLFPNIILGLSDHTPGHSTVLGAITLGARVIEKHYTDDKSRIGPDHLFSMSPLDWKIMVESARELEAALGSSNKCIELNEFETYILQRRSTRAARDIKLGETLRADDLQFLRPCPADSIPPYEHQKILGKKANKDIVKGDVILWKNLS